MGTCEQLGKLLRTDALTGIANRRHFDEQLATATARAKRTKAPISVMMLDIDWFKRVNDHDGHVRGDEYLCAVAGRIAAMVRTTDCAARWGGEEFIVLLPDTNAASAIEMADAAFVRRWRRNHWKTWTPRWITSPFHAESPNGAHPASP